VDGSSPKREKEIVANLIKTEIEALTNFVKEKRSTEMSFSATKEHIQELEKILKKIKS
jgi:MoaA/NifB/PqqE/SkfB family radical SAM enzyme